MSVAFLVFAILLFARPAAAEDFTLSVRVEVADLQPEIKRIVVRCAVCIERCERAGGPLLNTDTNVIGAGSAAHNFSGAGPRNFNGALRIAFNALPGRTAASARRYLCTLDPDTTAPGPLGLENPAAELAEQAPYYQPRPGTPYVARLEGSLSSPGAAPPPSIVPSDPAPRAPGVKGGTIPKGPPTLPK
jgi:hypothetical protein